MSDPRDQISITWCVDDVLSQAELMEVELTVEEARDILANVKLQHDCGIGINWDVIQTHIEMESDDTEEDYA